MNTVEKIVCHIEAELDEVYRQYKYWKDIDSFEAAKYLAKAHTIESILEQIEPQEESIAKILVSDPMEEKPKKTFLEIYINIFGFVVFISSSVSVWLIIAHLVELLGITGIFQEILCFGFLCLHIFSFLLMLINSNLLLTTGRA